MIFTDSNERPDIGQDYEDDWEVVVTFVVVNFVVSCR